MTNNKTKEITVEWTSPSNLAIVKYWGKRDIQKPRLRRKRNAQRKSKTDLKIFADTFTG